MNQCICSSKQHGHGDVCGRPTGNSGDFCNECRLQMATDRITRAEPNLTPTDTGSTRPD
jgi:hypothetical protein